MKILITFLLTLLFIAPASSGNDVNIFVNVSSKNVRASNLWLMSFNSAISKICYNHCNVEYAEVDDYSEYLRNKSNLSVNHNLYREAELHHLRTYKSIDDSAKSAVKETCRDSEYYSVGSIGRRVKTYFPPTPEYYDDLTKSIVTNVKTVCANSRGVYAIAPASNELNAKIAESVSDGLFYDGVILIGNSDDMPKALKTVENRGMKAIIYHSSIGVPDDQTDMNPHVSISICKSSPICEGVIFDVASENTSSDVVNGRIESLGLRKKHYTALPLVVK